MQWKQRDEAGATDKTAPARNNATGVIGHTCGHFFHKGS
jgi:hypothetical protein